MKEERRYKAGTDMGLRGPCDGTKYVVCGACVKLQIRKYDTMFLFGTEELEGLLIISECGWGRADVETGGALATVMVQATVSYVDAIVRRTVCYEVYVAFV